MHLLDVLSLTAVVFLESSEGIVRVVSVLVEVLRCMLQGFNRWVELLNTFAILNGQHAVVSVRAEDAPQEGLCIHYRHSACWVAATGRGYCYTPSRPT